MSLISPGGENLLDFLELRQVLSTYDGGLSGFLSRRCRGLSRCVESVPEPEDSSPVLTWILGYFWSLPRGVSPRLEWGACKCAFLPSCSSSVTLPFAWIKGSVAFPRGFPIRLSHDAFQPGFPTRLSPSDVPRATEIYTLSLHDALPIYGTLGTSGVCPGESVLGSCGDMHVRFPPEL